jgi:hypothetical protein
MLNFDFRVGIMICKCLSIVDSFASERNIVSFSEQ